MKKILLAILAVFFMANMAVADTINIDMEYAFNGVDELNILGFKLYQLDPEGVETVVLDIPDPDIRKYVGTIEAIEGRSVYTLVAYNTERESDRSTPYPFEYMKPTTPGFPAPTVIIRFN